MFTSEEVVNQVGRFLHGEKHYTFKNTKPRHEQIHVIQPSQTSVVESSDLSFYLSLLDLILYITVTFWTFRVVSSDLLVSV